MIDPSQAADAPAARSATRWSRRSIWRRPSSTISAAAARHILEGRSLLPLLRGERPPTGASASSEYDYSMQDVRLKLNQPIEQCRLFMVFDGRWKYIHASGFRPMLYDLDSDPHEFPIAAKTPHAPMSSRGCNRPCSIGRCIRRCTSPPTTRRSPTTPTQLQVKGGILIGIWDEAELAAELWTAYDRSID